MTLENLLSGKHWNEVTRTERYFVGRLAELILRDPLYFIEKVIVEHFNLDSNLRTLNWEVSTDVHLFRDISDFQNSFFECSKYDHLSKSMEFDLVLFSNELFIIFEAKAWCAFDPDQITTFTSQLDEFKEISTIETKTFGIHSSRYSPTSNTLASFDASKVITWRNLQSIYREHSPEFSSVFQRADRCYNNKRDDRENNLTNGFELL